MQLNCQTPYRFVPRDYQRPFWRAMDTGCKRAVLLYHRKAGKDLLCLNKAIDLSVERKGSYYYYFPSAQWGRKALWEQRTSDTEGRSFLDYFPPGSIRRKNDTEMVIETVWDATFRIQGTDNLEIVGPNPVGVVFSEYSLQDPRAWGLIQPILRANDGWAVFNYTPRGRNHAFRLWNIANEAKDWFAQKVTIDDTGLIDPKVIEQDIKRGLISRAMAMQEYLCSFSSVQDGAYYGEAMAWLRDHGRIRKVQHNATSPVYTAWDPGFTTAVWWFQIIGMDIMVLRSEQQHGWGMERWAERMLELSEKEGYRYGGHWAPFDTEANNAYRAVAGKSLLETARENGLHFNVLDLEKRVADGIERTRKFLYSCWIDDTDALEGLDALEGYVEAKQERSDPDNPVFKGKPAENRYLHLADAMRYMSMSAPRVRNIRAAIEREELGETITSSSVIDHHGSGYNSSEKSWMKF